MLPCISQICTLHASLEKDIEDYAAGHCPAVELWLGKVEGWLETRSVADLKALLAEHSILAPVASFQGGLLNSQGDARREHWAHFERRLALLAELGVGTLVVAGDIHGPLTQTDLDRVQVSLTQAAQSAGRAGMRVALEFQASATFGNNLQTAAALVGEVGSPHLGICLDAFHYYAGPSKAEDLAYLTPDNLFHVQFCDLVGTPRELASDGDRILPGDGDFQLQPIVDHLKAIDYRGAVSVETMNPQIWEIPPRQFGEIAVTALRKVLGLASMG
ncbi:MAG: sugar phosphate isomerase/epimerase [Planctomycetia bacterium]|nr:sugar phosphate isomerase/epimerase [Planctomycetia bacterium]